MIYRLNAKIMDIWNFIGFSASILGAVTFIPEVIKAFKTRHLRDVAWGMLFLVISSSTLWLIFGIKFNINPLILSSSINVILSSLLIFLKVMFREKEKSLKPSSQNESTQVYSDKQNVEIAS